MTTATIKSRWDYFEKGNKRGKYTERVKSEWRRNLKAVLKLPRSLPVEVVVELEEKKKKMKKNELSTILKFNRSHDKIGEDEKPIVVLSQMIKEYSLEQMEKATKVVKSR